MIRQTKLLINLILTIGFSFVCSFSTIADTETDLSVVGAWLGEAEITGSVYRLVFNISIIDRGKLTGTVDSPD